MDDSSDEEPPKRKQPIKPTKNEMSFRKEKYHDFADVLKDGIHCTVCSADLKHAVTKGETLHFHPLLEVLLCKGCRDFYGLGEISSDEDGYDKFCRFCAQGGKLYCCCKSTCTSAFCRKCLKRNLDENDLKLLKRDDWECLVCDPKPIYNQRAVCQAAIGFVQQMKHEKIEKRKGKLELLVMKKKNGDVLPRANRVRTREAKRNCNSDEVVEEMPHSSKVSFNIKHRKGNLSDNGCDTILPQGHQNTKVSQRLNKSQLQPVSSFEFSDSDFEPKHSQKPIKKEKIMAGENDKKEVIKRVKDNRNKKINNETIEKEKSVCNLKVKQQYMVLDGLADDIDCIGRMLTDRTDQFKKKYFSSKDCPEVMIPVIRQKMLRLAEVSVQSLSQLMKDLKELKGSSDKRGHIDSSSNVEEECEKMEVLQTSSRSVSENELAENSDDKIGNIEQTSTKSISENELAENSDDTIGNTKHTPPRSTSQNDLEKDSDDGVTNIKRCGSMTSDDEAVISVPNERLVNNNLADLSNVNCSLEADNEGPDQCNVPNGEMERDETDAVSTSSIHSGKTVVNQSLDLFDDSRLEEQNSDPTDIPEVKKASVPLSSLSLASKAKLLACSDDDCDSESSNTSLKVNSHKSKPGPASSKQYLSGSSESEIRNSVSKKKSNFSITDLEIYHSDTKLQGTWNVKIEKMDESREQEYLQLVGDYYEKDFMSSDSDSSIDRLTRLSNLRRWKGNGCRDDVSKAAPAHTSKEAEKKSDEDNKLTLQDFYGQSEEEDIESEIESNQEIPSKKVEDKVQTRNEFYKAKLLMSSDSEEVLSENDTEEGDEVKVSATSPNHSSSKHSDPPSRKDDIKDSDDSSPPDDHSTNETSTEKTPESKKKDWRQNRLLTMKLSDSDTDDDERRWNKKKSKQESELRKRLGRSKSETSDSEVSCQQIDSSSSEDFVKKRKRPSKKSSSLSSSESDSKKPEKKKVRKRIKVIKSSSSDDESCASGKEDSPNKGRKKIRRVIKEEDLGENTKFAAREEEERRKRIEERNKKFNEVYDDIQKNVEVLDKLVLDFDDETRQPLVEVDRELVKKLKPHQAKGVKFMWDACFESIQRIKKSNGSGCILAHCMGLGKSLQVVTLLHTLFNHPETKVHTALIVCPLSTVLNWVNEFEKWLGNLDNGQQVAVFDLTRQKQNYERQYRLKEWQEEGGVMVLGYEMYRNLSNPDSKRVRASILKTFQATLVNPGPDIVVCDEGHLLKNEDTAISKAMSRVKTLRRIVLTGTPLQNNLKEYHCMVQFVKPNLLGTRREFLNRFVNPISNGQFEDSTAHDVRTMKRRAHVLHKTLEGSVQRYDYSVLTPFLPTKQEYVVSVRLTELQETLYRHFLDNYSSRGIQGKGAQLFNDFQNFQRIWTHPRVLKMSAERNEIKAEKQQQDEDSEGSLRDFIDDDDDDETSTDGTSSHSSSSSDNEVQCLDDDKVMPKQKPSRRLRSNKDQEDPEPIVLPDETRRKEWWEAFVKNEDFEDLKASPKLVLLFSILKECEEVGDKLLVFSQSLFSLDLIEYFLEKIDDANQNGSQDETLNKIQGSWAKGIDFFRLDGQTPTELRSIWCKNFNNEENLRGRLFLISTRAGGLGINLVAANRVIIFDASWNPSHDVQSIFRVYRFGQKKPCFIYRFLAQGTMEEKIYERQVTKLSLACRVVDEQQIERHYNMADLQELYRFTPADRNASEKPKLPKDGLFAEILKAHEDLITSYHEHDSLLENKEDEELNEEERQAAWEEYENEKKGKLNALLPAAGFDHLPDVELLRDHYRRMEPMITDDVLEERVKNVYRQFMQDRLRQQKLQEQQIRQQQAIFRQQQLQQLQLLQQNGQMAGFLPLQAQYMQHQAPMTNPAFIPVNNPYGSLPSTSFGPTGTQNFK